MRLLEILPNGQYQLTRHLFNTSIPPYAILSHTWGAEDTEVTYQDLLANAGRDKVGYKKIEFCGNQAASHGLRYFWIDSCCIDKSSSTELSEAINSMFRWYKEAKVCFAYLSDVPATKVDMTEKRYCRFRASRWFQRGWTLQELLAPAEVHFFGANGTYMGDKSELADVIQEITNIPMKFLNGADLSGASVANKMAWASDRKTTRIEDVAYSLLGIFDINMPLLYGEGDKAFMRLQLEILKDTADESILAWEKPISSEYSSSSSSSMTTTNPNCKLFAPSPAYFAAWKRETLRKAWASDVPIEMTNKGLRMRIPIVSRYSQLGVLNCAVADGYERVIAMPLQRIGQSDEYLRTQNHLLSRISFHNTRGLGTIKHQTIYIKREQGLSSEVPAGIGRAVETSPWDCGWIYINIEGKTPKEPYQHYTHYRKPKGWSPKVQLLDVEPKRHWRKEWHMVAPKDGRDEIGKWHRTILHFGTPAGETNKEIARALSSSSSSAEDEDFIVILDRQTFLNAFFSRHISPPPFQLFIAPKPPSITLNKLLSSFPYPDTSRCKIDIGTGNRAVRISSMEILGRRYYVVDVASDVPSFSSRVQKIGRECLRPCCGPNVLWGLVALALVLYIFWLLYRSTGSIRLFLRFVAPFAWIYGHYVLFLLVAVKAYCAVECLPISGDRNHN